MKKTTSKLFTGLAGAFVVLGILVVANILLSSVRLRTDLTAERLYTLSPGTVAMVRELERPVTLKFYFTKGNPNIPVPLKNYVQRTQDFLRELVARSGGKLALEMLDPQPDSDAEEWAQRYGLLPQATGRLGAQPDFYLGLVAVAGTREAAIPVLDPSAESQLEYLVVRLVQEVTQSRRPRIGIMSSLPALAEETMPFLPPSQQKQDWLFVTELKQQYTVVSVPLDAKEIADDIDTLLVIHPKGISQPTLFALDQFVLRGGHLVAYLDPQCIADAPSDEMRGMPPPSSDINGLAQAWGVTVDVSRVVADVAAATPINIGEGRAERLPAWLTLRGAENLNPAEITTGSLESLMVPFAGVIQGKPAEGLQMTTLVTASSNAVTLNLYQARNALDASTRDGIPAPNAAIAVQLTGNFTTAFPDGPPAAEGEEADADKPADTNTWLKASAAPGAVVMVADADILVTDFMARGINFFGRTLYQPFNDNLNFTLNIVEQMSGSPALIGLRGRGKFDHPFDRVLALEKAAQEQWQAQEEQLQQKLMETQQRLNELQAAKSDDQQLVLSAEQKAELEKFRQQRFETQRQLKDVRKNLRHSIESLGLRLKVINLMAVPLVVAVFGVVLGWRRRRRAVA
ncbi:MAG TPA: Gldg family protein [Kiritimatiellia bacterium]|mgnify:FL=1|jgi:ABC-type uncharacterized transport system involved in gliding motility auxiliary subunit|nr:MAG: ABC-type uncharacterized transport system [Verrucomicrobia bacterium ADurb.Bin018]HOE00584.1 Gldg family protein [Kiritimatiellia bacterium]HOE37193.1 Gldg family protein [Kiritimatiellia bacterium]HOR74625.1 Gldg family protein [Kiritimatiellia bacterium]HOU59433.1 Gldg family protein [Kiritimatiellia bacterium]